MEELSIKQKAKRYDEAVEKAKSWYIDSQINFKKSLENLFPELKEESEDEKIRKSLLDYLHTLPNHFSHNGSIVIDWIAWLEKQGEKSSTFAWHSVSEAPDEMRELLCEWETDDAIWHDVAFYDAKTNKFRQNKMPIDNVTRWTYIDELLEKQGEQKSTDKVEPKFKVKYANSEYNVLEIKEIAGVTYYGIEDEPNHIDYVKAENCEIISVYAIKENGSPYPTKPAVFSGQKPQRMISAEAKESLLHDKYEGLTDFERTLADICIGWIGQELGWKQYIKDNADVLLKIAIKMFNSVQDATFEQKPTDNDMVEALRTEYEKGKADAIAEMQKEWSEKDEDYFDAIITKLEVTQENAALTDNQLKFLKSLKYRVLPQNHWKPSDEQIEALEHFVRSIGESGFALPYESNTNLVYSLLSDLKNLKE